MMGVVDAAGYRGWVGIAYEGSRRTEFEEAVSGQMDGMR